jgi:hypothetical protein
MDVAVQTCRGLGQHLRGGMRRVGRLLPFAGAVGDQLNGGKDPLVAVGGLRDVLRDFLRRRALLRDGRSDRRGDRVGLGDQSALASSSAERETALPSAAIC